jgi:hypothetical protein
MVNQEQYAAMVDAYMFGESDILPEPIDPSDPSQSIAERLGAAFDAWLIEGEELNDACLAILTAGAL